MTKDEALALALNALHTKGEHHPRVYEAIAAIQTVLAQPAQEPVAWQCAECGGAHLLCPHGRKDIPLYTAPPQRQWIWLSDADIAEVVDTTCQYTGSYEEYLIKKAERKIRSINT